MSTPAASLSSAASTLLDRSSGTDLMLPEPPIAVRLPAGWTIERLTWCFVVLGVVVRLVRFGMAFPLWCDEYQLSDNFLGSDFLQLLKPLSHNQVAPVGFLWIELAAVRLFGFSELSLRLFPTLCGILSLFLFRDVAQRLLRGVPLLFAVATFAVAYYPIRHGAEVKPYSSDLFCALVLFAAALRWWNAPGDARRMWLLAALAPLMLSISFTAPFIAGGISLGMTCTLWHNRRMAGIFRVTVAWMAFNLAVALAFFALMRLNVDAQYAHTQKEMTECWADGFPPWREPLKMLAWLAEVHTGPMFAYPIGAEHGGSVLTFLLFSIALVELFRRGRRDLALTIVGWFGLSLIAAGLHRYPYGSHARLSQYLVPAICLLAGSGGALLVARLRDPAWQSGAVRLSLIGGGVLAGGMLIRDVTHPFKTRLDQEHRAFARRFWNSESDTLTLCAATDLGERFYDRSFVTSYRCNQRIYSPAHHQGPQAGWELLERGERPIRCVVFHSASAKRDEVAFADWMSRMQVRYELAGVENHRVPLSNHRNDLYDFCLQCYDVYRFTPKPPGNSAAVPPPVARGDDPPRTSR